MCLIALSLKKELDWNGKEAYFFTLVANRDEYHERPTTHLHWWKGDEILAGKDDLAGGTWLGFSKSGRFAALTNFKENTSKKYKLSRGLLITNFLESNQSAKSYLESLHGQDYAGFNLIAGDKKGLFYYCNRSEGIYLLPEVPEHRIPKYFRFKNSKFIGQTQKWFLAEILCEDSKINLNASSPVEFDDWTWTNYWYPINGGVEFKKKTYRKVLTSFLPHYNDFVKNRKA